MARPSKPIRARERDTIIQALGSGVVPRIGLQHLQVGRALEVEALLKDITRISDGASAIRFVIGEYGAGKTFFLKFLIKAIALEKRLITVHADLGPNHRLFGTNGQARALCAETIKNMASRNKPEGGALESIIEVFIAKAQDEADKSGTSKDEIIRSKLATIREHANGFDFVSVIGAYLKGWEEGNEDSKANALRWIRGEFSTRTQAREALGVRDIVSDASIYNHWKLLAQFVRLAGYEGMLVILDEMVNVYKLQNAKARESNYEQILRILNDALQGQAHPIGFIMGGTPEFLRDQRRGMYSYSALQTRLADNAFARGSYVDLSGPVISLQNLTREELYVLLDNIRRVFASGDDAKSLIPDEALKAFMQHCEKRLGDSYFRTPRLTVKEFVNFLSVLEQNKNADWQTLLGQLAPEADRVPSLADIVDGDDGELTPISLK